MRNVLIIVIYRIWCVESIPLGQLADEANELLAVALHLHTVIRVQLEKKPKTFIDTSLYVSMEYEAIIRSWSAKISLALRQKHKTANPATKSMDLNFKSSLN